MGQKLSYKETMKTGLDVVFDTGKGKKYTKEQIYKYRANIEQILSVKIKKVPPKLSFLK